MSASSARAPLLTTADVVRAARDAGLGAPARFVSVTGSTNDDLLAAAARGDPEWTLLVAGDMTAGRGRLGRSWSTVPGASLATSLLLRPATPPGDVPLIALAAGVAMARACRSLAGVDVACKWPNDLVVRDRKIGGILCEATVADGRVAAVVVGTGVNVSHADADFAEELGGAATSIAIEGGREDAAGILAAYLGGLRALYGDGGAAIAGRVVEPYRALCATLGRRVRARTTDGSVVEGAAVDVAADGALVLETASGVTTVSFGEVVHLR